MEMKLVKNFNVNKYTLHFTKKLNGASVTK